MTAPRAGRAPDRVVVLTTDFLPQVGGVADHLHRLSESLAGSPAGSLAGPLSERMPVTVMTSVAQGGATWPHAYALDPLAPLPDRRLGRRFGDAIPPLRKLYTGAFFLSLRHYGAAVMKRIAPRPGEDVAILIGIWDTASHFWCAAARRAGLPYYLFAHGVELLIPLYADLPAWRRDDFARAARPLSGLQKQFRSIAQNLRGRKKQKVLTNVIVPWSPGI